MTHEHEDPTVEPMNDETSAWVGLSASWRGQELGPTERVRTEDIARRAGRFARTIRWRNARELAAAVLLIVVGVRWVVDAGTWVERLPGISMVVAVAWVVAQLILRGRNPSPPPPTATTTDVLAHERAQLARQVALLRDVRRWYLGPLLVPVVVTIGVSLLKVHERGGDPWTVTRILVLLGVIGFIAAVFVLIDRLNARAANALARKLESLGEQDSAAGSP